MDLLDRVQKILDDIKKITTLPTILGNFSRKLTRMVLKLFCVFRKRCVCIGAGWVGWVEIVHVKKAKLLT